MCTFVIGTSTLILGLLSVLLIPGLLVLRLVFNRKSWRRTPSQAKATPDRPGVGWSEEFLDGSQFAEGEYIKTSMETIHAIQASNRRKNPSGKIQHGFHAKTHIALDNAEFEIAMDIPAHLRVGCFTPGKKYKATLRFSNASGLVRPDSKKDLRGLVVRVIDDEGVAYDFLTTSAAVSHTRDVVQFMEFGKATAGSKLLVLPRLLWAFGLFETIRMLRTVLKQVGRKADSLSTERYWSRTPYAFGEVAVKFILSPVTGWAHKRTTVAGKEESADYLREDLIELLKKGDVSFDFQAQVWASDKATPIEDGTVEWLESDSPPVTLARLVIPQQDLTTTEAQATQTKVEKLHFNPWVTSGVFRPLGTMNRARRQVYQASAGLRSGRATYAPKNIFLRTFDWLLIGFFGIVNKFVDWHKLPGRKGYLGAMNLLAFRLVLKDKNLYDTDDPYERIQPDQPKRTPADVMARTADGTFNDLAFPKMGCSGRRLGRNVPRQYTYQDEANLMTPNPRLVSNKLLNRDGKFRPATTLSLLAAWWIQLQIHGWFFHDVDPDDQHEVPLPPGDDWDKCPMKIRKTVRDRQSAEEKAANAPAAYPNREPHWWDGSQIYGRTKTTEAKLRSGKCGKLKVDANNHLLIDPENGLPLTGFTDNMSLGLYALHELFVREHNSICEWLSVRNPDWTDQQLFQRARLINVAVMAKIHTIEWTPAILGHPSLDVGMNANWSGLATERLQRLVGRLSSNEAISGIPGSPVDHDYVPFTLTEEFTSVYRMHPLVPDALQLFSATTGEAISGPIPMKDMVFHNSQKVFADGKVTLGDVLYSCGIVNPGAITLHNHPDFLRDLSIPLPDGSLDRRVDLGTIDILRDRERGVPRYNQFRQLFHRPAVHSFEEVTGGDKALAAEIRAVYGVDENGKDNVNLLDLMVGLYAEPLPAGFGFSDTAFRVFILMASRRLESDRFFTTDFTAEVYGQDGLDWINENGFTSVVLRHHPELAPAFRGVKNPFAPLNNVND